MIIDTKEKQVTLAKFKNLLEEKKVHGVQYSNSLFSGNYLFRSFAEVNQDSISVADKSVSLLINARVEEIALYEIENLLEKLIQHEAGDVKGVDMYGDTIRDAFSSSSVEAVSAVQGLVNVDIDLKLNNVDVLLQEVTIAKQQFSIIHLKNRLDETFEQKVSILFGDKDKLTFLSHFYNKDLTSRDAKTILNLMTDGNITGRAIVGVQAGIVSNVFTSLYPIDSLVNIQTNLTDSYIISTITGFVALPFDSVKSIECYPNKSKNGYVVSVNAGKSNCVTLFVE